MDAVTWSRCARLLGLGRRSGAAIVGVEQVRRAAFRGNLMYAVVAEDASPHSRKKVVPLLAARRISFVQCPSARALGDAVGTPATTVVGIVDEQLAAGLRRIASPAISST